MPYGTAELVTDYLNHRETLQTQKRQVSRADTLPVKLAPGGGAYILIE